MHVRLWQLSRAILFLHGYLTNPVDELYKGAGIGLDNTNFYEVPLHLESAGLLIFD